jgi:hypothetical protein
MHALCEGAVASRSCLEHDQLPAQHRSVLPGECMQGAGLRHLLLPYLPIHHQNHFLQASGSVAVTLFQGESRQTVTYQAGCNDNSCSLPRADSARLRLAGGCSVISVIFTDAGLESKWLHVTSRRQSDECSSNPDYPSCNVAARRRSLMAEPRQHDGLVTDRPRWMLGPSSALHAQGSSDLDTPGRKLQHAWRHRRVYKAWLRKPDKEDPCLADPFHTDEDSDERVDIDAPIDTSCSLFQVQLQHNHPA